MATLASDDMTFRMVTDQIGRALDMQTKLFGNITTCQEYLFQGFLWSLAKKVLPDQKARKEKAERILKLQEDLIKRYFDLHGS